MYLVCSILHTGWINNLKKGIKYQRCYKIFQTLTSTWLRISLWQKPTHTVCCIPIGSHHISPHYHYIAQLIFIIQTLYNWIQPLSKSDFSMSPGFETELNRHMPVGSKRCQSVLALLVLPCHCLRQIEVNQICVRGLLLRALSLYSWQQWAHWWITVLYVKQCVYVFKWCVCDREKHSVIETLCST